VNRVAGLFRPKRLLRTGCLLALAALGGCAEPAGPPPSPAIPLPAPLGPPAFATELELYQPSVQWSADGRVIYAVNRLSPAVPYGIVAVDVASGQTRSVVTAGNVSIQVLRIAGDGGSLFYSSERLRTANDPANDGYSIFRVPTTGGGGAEELVRGAAHVFTISRDGRVLAWKSHTSDSTFVRDLADGATRHVPGGGFPLSISPDHSTLLHSLTPSIRLTASAIASGIGTASEGRLEDARWGGSGAELLFWGQEGQVMVQRGIAAPRQVLWAPGPAHSGYNLSSATWSPDGTRVVAVLARGCFSAPCPELVVLIDAARGTSRILMDAPAPLVGRASFAPDGRRIALTSGGHLHVIELPLP
jgi:hypothetical protein